MKNHPVNNDYVQNLQEGLLNEAALRMGKKERGAKPRKTHVGEVDNMGNVATNSARRKNIKDVGMEPMSGTGPGEVRPFNSGSTTTRKLKKVEEAVVNEADYAEDTGLNRAKNPENRKELARKVRNTRNADTVNSALRSTRDTKATETTETGKPIVSDLNRKAFTSNPAAQDSLRRGAENIASKKKVDENAQAGYPKQGIKGGTPKAAATHKRIMSKLRSAGGGKVYDRKKAEVEGDVERKRLEAAPALASIQKESYDVADSRLSDEELQVDKNVKTRGVRKKKGEKPVPMTNSKGEKIGEQDSGTRPRSQDLNTQGRLNKSREGEGMIAKGKRFIKKKFS